MTRRSGTLQSAVSATGNGTVLNVDGLSAVAFQVLGTFTATVTFEGTVDKTNWVSLLSYSKATGALATTATAPGVFIAACAGLVQIRARVTWTSGTSVTVVANAISDPNSELATGGSLGAAGPASSISVVGAKLEYETVAASQTAQVLGATGATGDYLSHVIIQPVTTGAGTVTILDNATVIFTFTTGTLSDLRPIVVPIGCASVSGAWKITTGANVTAIGIGDFT